MIQDLNKLEDIAKSLINDSVDDYDVDIIKLSLKYIQLLDPIIQDSTDWPTFNALLNQIINYTDTVSINFSDYIFKSIYGYIFTYFQDKLGTIRTLQLSDIKFVSNIFDETNIVEEKVWGVQLKNDVLVQGEPINTEDIAKEFKSVEDSVYLLSKKKFPEGEKNDEDDDIIEDEPTGDPNERKSEHVIKAVFNVASNINNMGQLILKGSTCPVCGKHVDFIPSNGFCSLQCAGLYLLNKAQESLRGESITSIEKVQEKIKFIKKILSYVNLTLNVFAKLPDVVANIAKLPDEWKRYATMKINIIFFELKQIINKLLILKNRIIIQLLSKIKFGTIDNVVQGILVPINTIIELVNALKVTITNALNVAYQAILKLNGQFYIGPQECGFFMTLKSVQAICPYFKTDVGTYPPGQLGRPYWGPSVMCIAFDMSRCQLSFDLGIKSFLSNRDFKKLNEIIKKIFLPIQEVEYLMDPDLFDVRLALSDQNAPTIQKLMSRLEKLVVLGGEFLPSWEDLKLSNIWYIVAILTCWGPWTKSIYGDYIFHGQF